MEIIKKNYTRQCITKSDINEHLPTLRELASECNHITEMGVRAVVSTWALLFGRPRTLRCFDIHKCDAIESAIVEAKNNGIDMTFTEADVLKVEIEETDMLFIDTLHQYTQLKRELALHANKVKKYLVFHDVETYGKKGEPADWQTPAIMENYIQNDKGIMFAINEFLEEHTEWEVYEHYKNNNGLLVLKKNG